MNEKALTPEQVAERLTVSTETIRRLIDAGKLRAFKVGRQWRMFPDDVEAYLNRTVLRDAA